MYYIHIVHIFIIYLSTIFYIHSNCCYCNSTRNLCMRANVNA